MTRPAAAGILAAIPGGQPVRRHTRAFTVISAGGQIAGQDAQVITSTGAKEEA